MILSVAGRQVNYDNSLSYLVATTPINTTVPIELIRDGKRVKVMATIAQRPAENIVQARAGLPTDDDETPAADDKAPGIESARASLGITLQPLTAQLRQQLRIDDKVQGVVVAGISPASDASAKGLQRGDIIVKIGQKPVTNPAEAAAAVDAERKAGKDTVLFAYDSYELDGDARAILARHAAWLKNNNVRVTLEGHADERGTREYNLALGERRANSVKNFLANEGVDVARLATISYGKERPVVEGADEAAFAQNRRAVTTVTR